MKCFLSLSEKISPWQLKNSGARMAGATRIRTLGNMLLRIAVTIPLLASSGAFGGDWPQFRGPNGDGTSTERILKAWPSGGPARVWKRAAAEKIITDGFSSFAVSQGIAYTMVTRSFDGVPMEVCLALNADTGAELWTTPLEPADYTSGAGTGDGPRSTPTVVGDRVLAFSCRMVLTCMDAANGNVLWRKDLPAEYSSSVIDWENAAAPVVEDELIYVNCNASTRSLLALRVSDGSEAWRAQNERMTHASPVAATILGVRQIIFLTQSGLISIVPKTGALLWRYTFGYSTSTAASPVVAGDVVYCSASYGVGAAAVQLTKSGSTFSVHQLWRMKNALENHWTTPVHYQGFLYGLYGAASPGQNPLKCVNIMTGEEVWSHSGFGPGGVLLVDGTLMVLSDKGVLVLVEPDPTQYKEIARTQAVTGKSWNVPAVSNGRVYVRSINEAACLDLSVPAPKPLTVQDPIRLADGSVRFDIAPTDGVAIDASRLGAIEVFTTTNLSTGPTSWFRLSAPLFLTNGVVRWEDATLGNTPERYFRVQENP